MPGIGGRPAAHADDEDWTDGELRGRQLQVAPPATSEHGPRSPTAYAALRWLGSTFMKAAYVQQVTLDLAPESLRLVEVVADRAHEEHAHHKPIQPLLRPLPGLGLVFPSGWAMLDVDYGLPKQLGSEMDELGRWMSPSLVHLDELWLAKCAHPH
jgi:hypothetical protein